ncbi:putative ECA polymerase [Candidatus Burkholderia brachyanthoides]|nr:putative ECA polymerase [Candidatus Burkholderia brachyanthoides]
MVYVVCILNTVALAIYWAKYREGSLRRIYLTLFVSCYVLTYFDGVLLAAAMEHFLRIRKITAPDSDVWKIVLVAEACLLLFLFGYWIAGPVRHAIAMRGLIEWRRNTKGMVFVSTGAFLVSVAIYMAGSDGPVLLKTGGYQNRYDANVGMGGYSLFFAVGLIACTLASLQAVTKRQKGMAALATIGYCALTFAALGGYRQLGFAALFSLGVIAMQRRDVTFSRFLVTSAVLIVITLGVALFRYTGTAADETGGLGGRLFIFFYDGFAPVDAFFNIVRYVNWHDVRTNVLINQLLTPVPRFIWSDKPLIVMNAGNFYTQAVLRRTESITYSPTLLGELYLLGGTTACAIGSFISGLVLRLFDELIIRSRKKMFVAFTFSFSFVLVFNLYREGIEVLITKFVLYGTVVAVMSLVARGLSGTLITRS